jgi:integrase
VEEKIKIVVNPTSWQASLGHLETFTGGKCRFSDLTTDFVEKYRSYLNCTAFNVRKGKYERRAGKVKKLSPNSAKIYFSFFVSAIEKAFKKKYLNENPTIEIESINSVKSLREFLTVDELKAPAQTECKSPGYMKRGALFNAFSGLRFSDIEDLTWLNVRENAEEPFLVLRIRKTGEAVVHPISPEARELLGERKDKNTQVFEGLKYNPTINIWLEKWPLAAGIDRRITFHAFRHTFSSIQLELRDTG